METGHSKIFSNTLRLLAMTTMIVVALIGTVTPTFASQNPNSVNQTTETFSQLQLYPNIETMGVVVSGTGLPKTAQLMYRKTGEANWLTGHPLLLVSDGRLIGSLFGLTQSTSYDVKVFDGSVEVSGSGTTQSNDLQFSPATILHVNASAPTGGDGSAAKPFQTIQDAINHATAGTQILVADGIYPEAVTFPASGTSNNWIQVKAEGSGAVLDSSVNLANAIWTPSSSYSHVWYTKIKNPIGYLGRDQKRFYKYDTLNGLYNSLGHNNVTMKEGWYNAANSTTLYVRSVDNPAKHSWQVPQLNYAFTATNQSWIWIEGFEIRFYGTGNGCGICATNVSHLVIRKNKIHNVQLGVFFNWNGADDQGNDTRVEYNEIYDPPVNEWPWKAVKATSMEGTGIVVRGHVGAIIRGNDIHNDFNGIYTGTSAATASLNPGIAFDSDIYNNYIHLISDDGLEPEGANINERFRNNTVDTSLTGISIAPVTQGPTWVLRNVFTNFTGTSIKWDLGSSGIILIYHNTSWTNAANLNAMSMIHPAHNAIMRNNIFAGNGYAFEEPFTGSTGMDWNYDDWFTTRGTTGPHFKWENIIYSTMPQLCAATQLECNGFENAPGFSNTSNGDFTLLASSPNIDHGIPIPGVNDGFQGTAPDIGAYEFGSDLPPRVSFITRADANPTRADSVNFTVSFSEPVTGVDANDFVLASSGLTGASITNVSGTGNAYTVTVNTGSTNGTLGLNLKDNDSIIDATGNPLGGLGLGNGSYTLGEIYTVVKTTTISTFTSTAANDGWILELYENSGTGGSINYTNTTFYLGDNAQNKQFRTILSFNTSALPDNAVIVGATLKIKRMSATGTDPFVALQNILVDIRSGTFGTSGLQLTDFQSASSMDTAGIILNTPSNNWFTTSFDQSALPYINKAGLTQFRLRFQFATDRNWQANTIKFYSGDDVSTNRPMLQIEYFVP
jgi:hypothetical protein